VVFIPVPTGGAHSPLPDPLAIFVGANLHLGNREGKGKRNEEKESDGYRNGKGISV